MKYTLAQLVAIQTKMKQMGGGFASALAEAMNRADAHNLVTIVNAFPDMMDEYWAFAASEHLEQQSKTVYKVHEHGTDCDGMSSDKVYEFDTKQEAEKFAQDCNEGSDGLMYDLI